MWLSYTSAEDIGLETRLNNYTHALAIPRYIFQAWPRSSLYLAELTTYILLGDARVVMCIILLNGHGSSPGLGCLRFTCYG